jgi:histidyl-tRNA synthetase
VVIPVGDAAMATAIRVATAVRRRGFATEILVRGNLKKRLARASEQLASTAVIIGDDELAAGEVTLKHLRIQQQERVPIDNVVEHLWPSSDR